MSWLNGMQGEVIGKLQGNAIWLWFDYEVVPEGLVAPGGGDLAAMGSRSEFHPDALEACLVFCAGYFWFISINYKK